MDVRTLLKKLQLAVRSEPADTDIPFGRTQKLPDDLRVGDHDALHVGTDISRRIRNVVAALLSDLHYEHLKDGADAAVWDFVCHAAIERSKDHVAGFIQQHHQDLRVATVRFSVEYLTVTVPFEVFEVTFQPLPAEDTDEGQRFRLDAHCGSLAGVEVSGTDMERMVARGREHVEHALRVLRISMANVEQLNEGQLRFKLGQWYAIEGMGRGFHRYRDAPIPLELPKQPAELFANFALLPIRYDDRTEIGRQAKLALGWINSARLAIDPIHKVAFLFSALESMLGDKSAGLKAPMLMYFRTLLGQVVNDGFPSPNRLYEFYDEVRSNAVHGEEVPEFTTDEVNRLEWSIRSALVELLTLCDQHKLTKRSQVRKTLLATEHARPTYDHL
ncbi:hypothetical protein Caci_7311 [Catenulispora acidiphila DSM 44928]|uniref:Apea-like HEPN domain-containing protein n=1 Tax=Catenulispora acidiphila (strain DSM 44928 / JCM 14897 / NBRC 102108 / NRRL B-24433 / ID139908) TaxID=479433 RepID=C7Q8F2_CATAD|nr:hypothetical protein [Catenulispora acidiphila]ACU76140.1 hypothetical protein Caci_7311 [Catenulispora acidiphila DSM 44928]